MRGVYVRSVRDRKRSEHSKVILHQTHSPTNYIYRPGTHSRIIAQFRHNPQAVTVYKSAVITNLVILCVTTR